MRKSLRKIAQTSFLSSPFGNVLGGETSPSTIAASPILTTWFRSFADAASLFEVPTEKEKAMLSNIRNIGISAHIDSGKTTLTERILFYTGRIREIHEVKGKDGVGATMDHMELEREKGITIQSAATYATWKDKNINVIDTPGHVDFTIEVERALRVLDGAILVLCGVGGVQTQTLTVDRQMKRYNVPRLCFINKLDRQGSKPLAIIEQIRDKLKLNAVAVQVPIGLEEKHRGVVDLVSKTALYFEGPKGETVREDQAIPAEVKELAEKKRQELIEKVADVDDQLADKFLLGEEIGVEELRAAIRRATVSLKLVPVFMGTAFKNKGVQPLLDGVASYLPNPLEVTNRALDIAQDEREIVVPGSPSGPLVALAFKLEEGRFGQLTFMRVYNGTLRRGDVVINANSGKKVKVPRLVRVHANELEDIQEAHSGQICAMFGVDCASGDTFTDGKVNVTMTSLHVPDPVMSLAITPKDKNASAAFSKALNRFTREDPTFRVHYDADVGQTIISGMGELHLEIYTERMRREYKVDTEIGKPRVNFRETITQRAEFDYLHKKQSGGQGQFGRVIGFIEPIPEGSGSGKPFEFINAMVGNNIPPNLIPSVEKGFYEASQSGGLIGYPVQGLRVVLTDGASHHVDSTEIAFKLAALGAFRQCYQQSNPNILEPIMLVEIRVPVEYQGTVMGDLSRRKGIIVNSNQEAEDTVIEAHVPLNNMFGYSTSLRTLTQGKGEFSMEYLRHMGVTADVRQTLVQELGSTVQRRGAAAEA